MKARLSKKLSAILILVLFFQSLLPSWAIDEANGAVTNSNSTLTSNEHLPEWAQKEITELQHAGLIQGYEDGSFIPDGQITRASLSPC